MASNQITFGVGFKVDESGLKSLRTQLQEIQRLTTKDIHIGVGEDAEAKLSDIKAAAEQVEAALRRSFNPNLNTLNITKFQAELQNISRTTGSISSLFNAAGSAGQRAMNVLATRTLTTNNQLKQTFSIVEKMKETLGNTIKWNIASSAVNAFTGAVRGAFSYVESLDRSLTSIRVVTGESRDEMAKFAIEANNAAQALGRQTKEYTNAALTFYQQGLNDEQVRVRTEAVLKAQNITNSGSEMADYLTAVWNGFKVSVEDTVTYVDKLAAVADSSASDMSELAIAMSKVASTANNMGVTVDQLTAQIATIVATTRVAPETVGNALKTIYARINDIKAGTDEAEISLGQYTKRMRSLGINVLDSNGRLRDTGDTMTEIGEKWSTMTREQQIYLAQTMAGQRQMNNLVSLFDNWRTYTNMLNTSLNATGTLEEKNARYLESVEAHVKEFRAAIEGLQDTIIDEDLIKSIIDLGTTFVNSINTVIKSVGGIKPVLLTAGSRLASIFSSDIANVVLKLSQNFQIRQENANRLRVEMELLRQFKEWGIETDNETLGTIVQWKEELIAYRNVLSESEQQAGNRLLREYTELMNQKKAWEESKTAMQEYLDTVAGAQLDRASAGLHDLPSREHPEGTNTYLEEYGDWEGYKKQVKDATDTLAKFNKQRLALLKNETQAALREDEKSVATYEDSLKKAIDQMRIFRDSMKMLVDRNALNADQLSRLTKRQREYDIVLKDGGDTTEAINNLYRTYVTLLQEINEKNKAGDQIIREKAGAKEEEFRRTAELIQQNREQLLQDAQLKETVQTYISIVSAVGQISSVLMTISNIPKIWDDKNLSLGEKLLRTLTAIGSAVGMGAAAWSRLTKALKGSYAAQIQQQKTTAQLEIAKLKEAQATARQTRETQKQTKAVFELRAAEAYANKDFATYADLQVKIRGVNAEIAASDSKIRSLGQLIGKGGKLYQQILGRDQALKPTQLLKHRLDELGTTIQTVIGKWGAYIGIGAIVLVNLKLIADEFTRVSKAERQARETAQQLTQTYRDTQEQYDDLKNSITDYNNLIDTTEQLAVGTQAWYDSIDAVNEKVTDLISQYPELASAVTTVNGHLQIAEDTLDSVLSKQKEIVSQRRMTSLVSQVAVNNANSNTLIDQEYRRRAGITRASTQDLTIQNTSADSTSGMLSQVVHLDQASFDRLRQAYTEGMANGNLVETMRSRSNIFSTATEAQIVAIFKNSNSLDKQRDAVERNTKANAVLTQEIGRLAIEDSDIYQNGTDGERRLRAALAGQTIADATPDKLATKWWQVSGNAVDAYAEANGYQATRTISGKTQFLDQRTGAAIENITPRMVQLWYETNKRAEDAIVNSEETIAKIREAKLPDKILSVLANYINTDQLLLENFTLEEIDGLMSTITDETLKELKIDKSAFEKARSQVETRFRNLWKEDELVNKYTSLQAKFEKSTFSVNKQVIDLLHTTYANFGSKTTDAVAHALTSLTNPDKFFEAYNAFDFSTGTFDEFLSAVNKATGGVTKDMIPALSRVYDIASRFSNLAPEETNKLYTSVLEKAQKGQTIDEATYNQLAPQIQALFHRDRDGNYKLDRKIDTLSTAIYRLIDRLFDREYTNAKNDYQNLQNYDWLAGNTRFKKATRGIYYNTGDDLINLAEGLLASNNVEDDDRGKLLDIINDPELAKANEEFVIGLAKKNARFFTEKDYFDSLLAEQYKTYVEKRNQYYENQIDSDVNDQDLVDVKDYLLTNDPDRYKNVATAAEAAAEAIVRYDVAADRALKNEQEWRKVRASRNKNDLKYIKTLSELRNTYGDLLNVDDVSLFNNEFLESEENFELMMRRARGDIEAHKELWYNFTTSIAKEFGELPENYQTEIMSLYGILNTLDPGEIDLTKNIKIPNFVESLITRGWSPQKIKKFFKEAFDVDLHMRFEEDGTFKTIDVPNIVGIMTGEGSQSFPVSVPSGRWVIDEAFYGGGFSGDDTVTTGTGPSGGGSKKKSPQQKFKAKIDPYHDVNIKLKDNEQTLKNLQKQQDKVYGGEALQNLLKQVDVLAKERDLLKEKFDINVRELHNQQEQLKGYGATFDALGRISNYESLLLSKQNQINALIDQYNAMQNAGADDDALQAINDRISALKEEYQTVESLISEYDSSSDQLQELFDNATEKLEEMLDAAQQMFYLPIEVGLDIQTREKDWLEFKRDIVDRISDDNFFGQIDVPLRNMNLVYNDDGTGMAQQIAPLLSTALQELQIVNAGGFSNLFGTDQNKAREMVQKLYDDATKQLESYYDSLEKTQEIYLDTINAMKDAFDAQLEGYDKVADTIEQDLKIAELLNGEDNYVMFQRLYDQQHANDEQRVDMRRLQLRVLQQEWAKQKELLATTQQGTKEYQDLEEQLKALEERTQSAFQTLNESLQQAIESAAAAWENAMKAMRQQTDQAFFGDRYMFDQMWEYTDWHEDTYLDPLEKANHLLDIQLDFNKEINNADEKHRKNLIALRDKIIDRLEAQEHIRESDIELAKRELEVAKAQMALEDARNNKTTMRLRRDSQGNYTYQYVADADNIADKLKDYRDAMEKYRQLAMDTVKDIRKELYEAYDESQDKLYEFMEKYRGEIDGQAKALRAWKEWMRSDEGKVTLIAEDLVRRLAAMRESTTRELQGLDSAIGTAELLKKMGIDQASAFGQALTQMLEAAGPNIWDTLINGNTAEVTQILEDKLLGVVDQFDGMYGSAIDQMATDPETTQANMTEMARRADEYAAQYRDSLERIKELSGTVFEDYAAGADPALQFNAQLIQDNEALTSGYQEMAASIRDDVAAALDELADHKPEIDALNETLQNTVNVLNTVDFSEYADLMEKVQGLIAGRRQQKYSDDQLAVRITQNSGAGLDSSMPTYDTREPVNGNYDTNAVQSDNLQTAINQRGQLYQQTLNDAMQKIANGETNTSYNADIAAAQQALSDLGIQRYNQYIIDQLSNIDSSMLDKLAQAGDFINQATSGDNVLNQDVHIDATFPNVQSAAEIERAFNNLVNLASQRANSNRRRNNG